MVARDVLRVCADPHNMPFSNWKGEGFENRIAEILADELKVPLRYYWLSQGPGFVANTLGSKLCDLVMGYAAGADPVQHTTITSVYVLLIKPGAGLDGVDRLSDGRLQGKRLGSSRRRRPPIIFSRRVCSRPRRAMRSSSTGAPKHQPRTCRRPRHRTDRRRASVGPIGGDLARRSSEPLTVIPLLHERDRPPLSYRITFGIRHNEQDWKRRLNQAIRKRQADFDRVLRDFGVPLLDDNDRLIGAPRNAAK